MEIAEVNLTVSEQKKLLREIMIKKGQGLSREYIAASDLTISQKVFELPEFSSARSIFVYVSRGFEPDTYRIIGRALELGKSVYVPRIVSKGIMFASQICSASDLVPGRFGIPAAPADASTVPAGSIDLSLIPCVCASLDGFRLGYGGGYYDRYFAFMNVESYNTDHPRAANSAYVLCRNEMVVESVPHDIFDVRFDGVIS
ncbi:MAG: 5-formyltetrahydrofolate cyclo-ligase [Clostridia bacterium]|nr:5-formyltetrahydrofolate cyclo-ligase [Clostridia bacterium]